MEAEERRQATKGVGAAKGKKDMRSQNEKLYAAENIYNPKLARAQRKRAKKGGGDDDSDFEWEAPEAGDDMQS